MTEKKKSLTPGIILIAIGCFFLLRRSIVNLPVWEQVYPFLILGISGLLFWEALRNKNSAVVFWGVFTLCIGAFFLLRNFDIIPWLYIDEYWPVFMLAPGIAFIVQFIINPRDWGVLVPGTLLIFFGMKNLLYAIHGYFWEWDFFLDNTWPLIIIVIGIGMVISGIRLSKKTDKNLPENDE